MGPHEGGATRVSAAGAALALEHALQNNDSVF